MMKIRNKIKNSFLTATILLAISGGSAYAMPTGGNVTMGDVTNVANPAEIMTANANSIINWDSFSVGVGEKVTFDTQKFMVLNRVVGGQESQILGMLSDQGEGKLLLINPNGIVLGENAVINANDLVLSTLRLSDDEFKNLLNGNRSVFKDENNDRGKIEIKSGTNLTLNEALRLYGGKITIADGVEIVSKDVTDVKVEAIGGTMVNTNLKNGVSSFYDDGTNVEIGAVKIGTEFNPISDVVIRGDKIVLDNTDITVDSNKAGVHDIFVSGSKSSIFASKLLNKRGDIILVDRNNWSVNYNDDGSIKTFELEADPDNEINIVNSNINTMRAKDITILGGNVNLYNSQLNSGKDIFVGAVKTYNSADGVRTATTYSDSTINADKNTIVHALGRSEAYGANLNIQAQKFDNLIKSENPFIQIIGKDGINLNDIAKLLEEDGNHDEVIKDMLYNYIVSQLKPDEVQKIDIKNRVNDIIIDIRKRIEEKKNYIGPNKKIDGFIQTGKMYIDEIQTSEVDENGNITVSFNVYNWTPVPGVIEIYDESGEIIDRKWIEGHKTLSESVAEAFGDVIELGKGVIDGTYWTYKSKTDSTLNKYYGDNSIVVPKGGSIRITNNVAESPDLGLYTFVGKMCDDFLTIKKVSDVVTKLQNPIDSKKFTASVMKNIMTVAKENGVIGEQIEDVLVKATSKSFDLGMEMKGLGIDIPDIMKNTVLDLFSKENIGETVVNTVASITDVFGVQGHLFTFNTVLNSVQYDQYRNKLRNAVPVELRF